MLAGIEDAQLQTSIPIGNNQRTWHSEPWSQEAPAQEQVDPAHCRGAAGVHADGRGHAGERVGVMQVDE